jgi:hypothetical protein
VILPLSDENLRDLRPASRGFIVPDATIRFARSALRNSPEKGGRKISNPGIAKKIV